MGQPCFWMAFQVKPVFIAHASAAIKGKTEPVFPMEVAAYGSPISRRNDGIEWHCHYGSPVSVWPLLAHQYHHGTGIVLVQQGIFTHDVLDKDSIRFLSPVRSPVTKSSTSCPGSTKGFNSSGSGFSCAELIKKIPKQKINVQTRNITVWKGFNESKINWWSKIV